MSDSRNAYSSSRVTAKEVFVLLFGGLTIWVAITGAVIVWVTH